VFDLGAAAANDRFAFLAADSAADALGQGDDEYSAIEIQVDDVFVSTEVAARLGGTVTSRWSTGRTRTRSCSAAWRLSPARR
jgi:hypothetical protein